MLLNPYLLPNKGSQVSEFECRELVDSVNWPGGHFKGKDVALSFAIALVVSCYHSSQLHLLDIHSFQRDTCLAMQVSSS